jgi:YjbE family integral membrane protein
MEMLSTPEFWLGLLKIIGVNIILSGDNAVVIALAARSLPPKQQKQAVFWGAGAAIVLRILLTIFAVKLLELEWLKLIGSLLLFWIGVKLLVPEDGDDEIKAHDHLMSAIRTILIADLVMSLDNVIAVAAAAGGNLVLLILGLGISIPLVIFGATLLIKLMEKYPVIITIGAALIGWVAGEMLIADLALRPWLEPHGVQYAGQPPDIHPVVSGINLEYVVGAIGVVIVVVIGKWLAGRQAAAAPQEAERPNS